jgi:hypothetical protein
MKKFHETIIDLFEQGFNADQISDMLDCEIMEVVEVIDEYVDENTYDDSMDGDHATALASVGWGTDEDYGYAGEPEFDW